MFPNAFSKLLVSNLDVPFVYSDTNVIPGAFRLTLHNETLIESKSIVLRKR